MKRTLGFCVTQKPGVWLAPRSGQKKFEQPLLDQDGEEVRPGVEVKPCSSPEETFVACRSIGRKKKGRAILNRFVTRREDKLMTLALGVGQDQR